MEAGGSDVFMEQWDIWMHMNRDRWMYIYLFPPPATMVLLQVCQHLRMYGDNVLLIAPWWEVQLWFSQLLWRCPSPLPLGLQDFVGIGSHD